MIWSIMLPGMATQYSISKTFAESGIEVVASETFATGDTDFSAQLTRIKESNPDAIFVSAQQIEVIEIFTQGRQLGIPSEIPFITTVLSVDEIQSAGDAAEGAITFTAWVSTADTPGNQAFVQNYTARYGMEPSVWAAPAVCRCLYPRQGNLRRPIHGFNGDSRRTSEHHRLRYGSRQILF